MALRGQISAQTGLRAKAENQPLDEDLHERLSEWLAEISLGEMKGRSASKLTASVPQALGPAAAQFKRLGLRLKSDRAVSPGRCSMKCGLVAAPSIGPAYFPL